MPHLFLSQAVGATSNVGLRLICFLKVRTTVHHLFLAIQWKTYEIESDACRSGTHADSCAYLELYISSLNTCPGYYCLI